MLPWEKGSKEVKGIKIGVTKNVCKLGYILMNIVKCMVSISRNV